MKLLLLTFAALLGYLNKFNHVHALSCLPCENAEEICGKPPVCCKSGYYTKDACGCCKICAKVKCRYFPFLPEFYYFSEGGE